MSMDMSCYLPVRPSLAKGSRLAGRVVAVFVTDQVEFIGRFAFAEQIFRGRETHIARAARDRAAEFGTEAGEERLLEDDASSPSIGIPL